MAKQPYISHVVNGYSRYDLPESVAFTCTPGILYPVRVDFINARDRVSIDQGIDVRSNPLAVPSFNPYTVRLHRFWVPLQLYHPEMRTNSSAFDMNDLSLNFLFNATPGLGFYEAGFPQTAYPNSLMSWLYGASRDIAYSGSTMTPENYARVSLSDLSNVPSTTGIWVNADPYLAYWDIVRNYYSFSQWKAYSFAWPASWYLEHVDTSVSPNYEVVGTSSTRYFSQRYGNLEHLDAYYESQFYPNAVASSDGTYNRGNLFLQIVNSDLDATVLSSIVDGYPVASLDRFAVSGLFTYPVTQFNAASPSIVTNATGYSYLSIAHPMAVIPSSPDRFSRLLPPGTSNSAVSMSGVTTIPQLAVAARLQEYKDLLGAGGSRFSDWLETFFASKIEHVDRPKLLFSASQTVNVQVVLNQAGRNNNVESSQALGQQGGAIAFNSKLGRSQSYYFREPGYMIDMLSIRPVYYWTGILPDWAHYQGADYFNPVYNDIGYQDVPLIQLAYDFPYAGFTTVAQEPCFNEFRASYDRVQGQFADGQVTPVSERPLYSYWVQQRSASVFGSSTALKIYPLLFVDMSTVNSPFASDVEDNFFVNLSYSVRKKNLVNKTFATRLANR